MTRILSLRMPCRFTSPALRGNSLTRHTTHGTYCAVIHGLPGHSGVLLEINSRQQCQALQHHLCSLLPVRLANVERYLTWSQPTCLKYSGEQLPSLWKLVSSQLLDASNNRLIRVSFTFVISYLIVSAVFTRPAPTVRSEL